ncbi:MAG TPA: hypothetical protein VGM43_07380, partial [Bryobacteraceae bacterium]
MNWPTIGGIRITALRMVFLALVAVEAALFAAGSGNMFAVFVLLIWASVIAFRERRRVMWKVRDRLIVTYVFIAVVPITLILALIFVAGYLLMGQTSAYLIGNALDRRGLEIEKAARLLAAESPEDRLSTARHLTATGILDFEAFVTGDAEFRYPANTKLEMPAPEWNDYTGLVFKDNRHYLMSFVKRGGNKALILRTLTPEDQTNLVRGLGSITFPIPPHTRVDGPQGKLHVGNEDAIYRPASGKVGPAYNPLDTELTWLFPVQIAAWDRPNSELPLPGILNTRPSALFGVISGTAIGSDLALYI